MKIPQSLHCHVCLADARFAFEEEVDRILCALFNILDYLETQSTKNSHSDRYIDSRKAVSSAKMAPGMGFEPMRPNRATGSQGLLVAEGQPSVVDIPSLLADFKQFLEVDLQLSKLTVNGHAGQIKRFLKNVKKCTRKDIRSFLAKFKDKSPNTYANVLKSLRVFFRDFLGRPDLVKSFRFPHREPKVKVIPSKSELQQFYEQLRSARDKVLFLMYATTGLRASEVLALKLKDVDFEQRMVNPESTNSRTKRTWISFFNRETEKLLRHYLVNRKDKSDRLFPISRRWLERIFQNASKRSGIRVTPQMLREWFCSEMA